MSTAKRPKMAVQITTCYTSGPNRTPSLQELITILTTPPSNEEGSPPKLTKIEMSLSSDSLAEWSSCEQVLKTAQCTKVVKIRDAPEVARKLLALDDVAIAEVHVEGYCVDEAPGTLSVGKMELTNCRVDCIVPLVTTICQKSLIVESHHSFIESDINAMINKIKRRLNVQLYLTSKSRKSAYISIVDGKLRVEGGHFEWAFDVCQSTEMRNRMKLTRVEVLDIAAKAADRRPDMIDLYDTISCMKYVYLEKCNPPSSLCYEWHEKSKAYKLTTKGNFLPWNTTVRLCKKIYKVPIARIVVVDHKHPKKCVAEFLSFRSPRTITVKSGKDSCKEPYKVKYIKKDPTPTLKLKGIDVSLVQSVFQYFFDKDREWTSWASVKQYIANEADPKTLSLQLDIAGDICSNTVSIIDGILQSSGDIEGALQHLSPGRSNTDIRVFCIKDCRLEQLDVTNQDKMTGCGYTIVQLESEFRLDMKEHALTVRYVEPSKAAPYILGIGSTVKALQVFNLSKQESPVLYLKKFAEFTTIDRVELEIQKSIRLKYCRSEQHLGLDNFSVEDIIENTTACESMTTKITATISEDTTQSDKKKVMAKIPHTNDVTLCCGRQIYYRFSKGDTRVAWSDAFDVVEYIKTVQCSRFIVTHVRYDEVVELVQSFTQNHRLQLLIITGENTLWDGNVRCRWGTASQCDHPEKSCSGFSLKMETHQRNSTPKSVKYQYFESSEDLDIQEHTKDLLNCLLSAKYGQGMAVSQLNVHVQATVDAPIERFSCNISKQSVDVTESNTYFEEIVLDCAKPEICTMSYTMLSPHHNKVTENQIKATVKNLKKKSYVKGLRVMDCPYQLPVEHLAKIFQAAKSCQKMRPLELRFISQSSSSVKVTYTTQKKCNLCTRNINVTMLDICMEALNSKNCRFIVDDVTVEGGDRSQLLDAVDNVLPRDFRIECEGSVVNWKDKSKVTMTDVGTDFHGLVAKFPQNTNNVDVTESQTPVQLDDDFIATISNKPHLNHFKYKHTAGNESELLCLQNSELQIVWKQGSFISKFVAQLIQKLRSIDLTMSGDGYSSEEVEAVCKCFQQSQQHLGKIRFSGKIDSQKEVFQCQIQHGINLTIEHFSSKITGYLFSNIVLKIQKVIVSTSMEMHDIEGLVTACTSWSSLERVDLTHGHQSCKFDKVQKRLDMAGHTLDHALQLTATFKQLENSIKHVEVTKYTESRLTVEDFLLKLPSAAAVVSFTVSSLQNKQVTLRHNQSDGNSENNDLVISGFSCEETTSFITRVQNWPKNITGLEADVTDQNVPADRIKQLMSACTGMHSLCVTVKKKKIQLGTEKAVKTLWVVDIDPTWIDAVLAMCHPWDVQYISATGRASHACSCVVKCFKQRVPMQYTTESPSKKLATYNSGVVHLESCTLLNDLCDIITQEDLTKLHFEKCSIQGQTLKTICAAITRRTLGSFTCTCNKLTIDQNKMGFTSNATEFIIKGVSRSAVEDLIPLMKPSPDASRLTEIDITSVTLTDNSLATLVNLYNEYHHALDIKEIHAELVDEDKAFLRVTPAQFDIRCTEPSVVATALHLTLHKERRVRIRNMLTDGDTYQRHFQHLRNLRHQLTGFELTDIQYERKTTAAKSSDGFFAKAGKKFQNAATTIANTVSGSRFKLDMYTDKHAKRSILSGIMRQKMEDDGNMHDALRFCYHFGHDTIMLATLTRSQFTSTMSKISYTGYHDLLVTYFSFSNVEATNCCGNLTHGLEHRVQCLHKWFGKKNTVSQLKSSEYLTLEARQYLCDVSGKKLTDRQIRSFVKCFQIPSTWEDFQTVVLNDNTAAVTPMENDIKWSVVQYYNAWLEKLKPHKPTVQDFYSRLLTAKQRDGWIPQEALNQLLGLADDDNSFDYDMLESDTDMSETQDDPVNDDPLRTSGDPMGDPQMMQTEPSPQLLVDVHSPGVQPPVAACSADGDDVMSSSPPQPSEATYLGSPQTVMVPHRSPTHQPPVSPGVQSPERLLPLTPDTVQNQHVLTQQVQNQQVQNKQVQNQQVLQDPRGLPSGLRQQPQDGARGRSGAAPHSAGACRRQSPRGGGGTSRGQRAYPVRSHQPHSAQQQQPWKG